MSRRQQTATNRRKPRAPAPSRWRTYVVFGAFVVFAVGLAGRAFFLQVLNQDFLIHQGEIRHVRTLEVPAMRGAIVDRNGEPLALSAPTKTIWAVPGELLEAPEKIAPLAHALGVAPEEMRQRLHQYSNRQFMYLARQLAPADARKVMAVDAPGVFQEREFKRYYPAGEAAAQIVGLVNIDGKGQLGMELYKHDFLDGKTGSRRVIKDRQGRVVEDLDHFVPPQPGHQLRLTINLRLQYMAYREIKKAVLENNAASGIVVLLDPDNGQLLAVASYPSFNPNDRSTITPKRMRARAVINIFEPGSSIKPLLLAEALDSKQFNVDSRIHTDGAWFKVGSLVITDYGDYGNETFAKILQKSSNIGAAKVGLKMGAEKVYQGYRELGLGMTTGTGFPGEGNGILKPYYKWGAVELATASYGYGVATTALQMVRAYGAIADDGKLHPLSLIIGPGAHMQPPPKQVISPKTARQIRHMLDGVVSPAGTAGGANIPGYSEGGKTGTARLIVNGAYSHNKHQALFIGMAPIEDPALVAFVLVDAPSAGQYYAAHVAVPVWADIVRKALRVMHVPPTWPKRIAGKDGDGEVS